jgi:hypothetical protein
MSLLESDLLALETTTPTVPAKSTAATTTTTTATATTTATKAAAATTTTAKATTTTTAAAAEAAAAATVVVTGLSVVQTDGPAIKVGAVERVKSRLGILDRAESHVGKTLGAARLPSSKG